MHCHLRSLPVPPVVFGSNHRSALRTHLPNFSEIKQSAEKLLRFKYAQFQRLLPSCIWWEVNFHNVLALCHPYNTQSSNVRLNYRIFSKYFLPFSGRKLLTLLLGEECTELLQNGSTIGQLSALQRMFLIFDAFLRFEIASNAIAVENRSQISDFFTTGKIYGRHGLNVWVNF